MSSRGTVVSAMATHLPTGRGSPVSIHGLPVLRDLEASLRSAGLDWIAIERFDPRNPPDRVIALWDFGSLARLPKALKQAAEGRIVAWSLESPLVAHRGYHRLPKIAESIADIVSYPGVGSLIDAGRARFHPVGWPNSIRRSDSGPSWRERKLLVMINSNKRLHQWREGFNLQNPVHSARLFASSVIAKSYGLRGQWQVPDLYNERIRAIAELGSHPGFTLLGVGWSTRLPGWSESFWKHVNASYGGEVPEKRKALQQFRFALCIENTIFPGYISEKIFDALLAGTIPIYLGAPDINQYIPRDAYIDLRDFPSYAVLIETIAAMDATELDGYQRAANAFLRSPKMHLFTERHFEQKMLGAIESLLSRTQTAPPV